MKLHMPQVHSPAFLHRRDHPAADEGEHHHHHLREDISHAVEVTLDKVEHGVDAIDPLHFFSPNEIPTRLVYKEGALSKTGDAYSLICARSNDPFHDFQVKEKSDKSDDFVVEHSVTKLPLVKIERTEQPRKYDIFIMSPQDKELYHFAKVLRDDKVLHVFLEGQSESKYVISKAGLAGRYATKHWIKRVGEKEAIASTHPWEGENDMLEVKSGEEVIFMYCLALIADEMLK